MTIACFFRGHIIASFLSLKWEGKTQDVALCPRCGKTLGEIRGVKNATTN